MSVFAYVCFYSWLQGHSVPHRIFFFSLDQQIPSEIYLSHCEVSKNTWTVHKLKYTYTQGRIQAQGQGGTGPSWILIGP